MYNYLYKRDLISVIIYIYIVLLRLLFKTEKSYIIKGNKKILTSYKVNNDFILKYVWM